MRQQSIGKDAAMLSIAKLITLAVGMISIMLLSRFRTLSEYGTFSQIQLSVSLASVCLIPDLASSISYFFPQAQSEKERCSFISTFYGFSLILTAFIGLLLVLTAPSLSLYFHNPIILQYRYVLGLLPWTNLIISSLNTFLIANGQIKKITIFTCVYSLSLLGAIMLTKVMDLSFSQYMLLYAIVQLLYTLAAYRIVFNIAHKIIFFIDTEVLKRIIKFSVPLGISALIGTLSYNIDTLMIGRFLGTEMLAIYTNAGRELPLTIISTSLTAVLLPNLSRLLYLGKTKTAIELWMDGIKLSYIFILFGIAALVVFAPQIMTFLYSEEYLLGVNVFRIYSVVLLWRGTYFGMLLNVTNNSDKILICSIMTLILNVLLNYLLYFLIGFSGPALASFITIGAGNLIQLAYTAKITGIQLKHIFPWSFVVKNLSINVISGIFVYGLVIYMQLGISSVDILLSIIIGLVWMGLYFSIMKKVILYYWRKINDPIILT